MLRALFDKLRPKPKERPFLWLNQNDYLTGHQMAEGCFISGAIGSGKTSGPYEAIARATLEEGGGVVVMTAKPDEVDRWWRLCRQTGRTGSFVNLSPGQGWQCDLLNEELSHPGGSVESATGMLYMLDRISGRESGSGGGDARFFEELTQRLYRMAIGAVWYVHGKCSLSDIHRFLTTAPENPQQLTDPNFQARSDCLKTLVKGAAMLQAMRHSQDFLLCMDFWGHEWPNMSSRTRSSAYATAINLLDKFMFGHAREMFSSGKTNLPPKRIREEGLVCILGMDFLTYRDPGRFGQILFKTLVQREVMRSGGTRPVTIFQDEGQIFVTEQDVEVQAVARQFQLRSVFATQSIPVLRKALGGGLEAEQQAKALIGNHQVKIMCQQAETDTCKAWSEMIGQELQMLPGGGGQRQDYCPIGEWMGEQQGGAHFHSQFLPSYRPEWFATLRKGRMENNFTVEAIVFAGGKLFSNNKTWIKAQFKQQG